jgi:hypothetical protein
VDNTNTTAATDTTNIKVGLTIKKTGWKDAANGTAVVAVMSLMSDAADIFD